MGILQVKEYFKQYNIPEEIREFDVSSATVDLASKALGVEPQLIAKTLSFAMDDSAILVLAAGNARIDNHKFRDTFHKKAKMLSADDVIKFTGHPVGGVCPFALAQPLRVYLDESLRNFKTVYPAAGSPASCVVITPERLQALTNAEWVNVCSIPV